MTFAAGTVLGTYEITGLLGAGGMGEVYRGRDTRLDRPVALKVLPAALAADPRFRQRFDREARVISRLNHPQICTVYDIGDAQGVSFLVMELVEGETLRAWGSRQRAQTISDIVAIVLQISRALAAAHTAGIVHRDIKPDNVIVRADGTVKVLDVGVAKLALAASAAEATTGVAGTEFGSVIGTTRYMSPEQARGVEVDGRSDIFSLGIVLYELLTGHAPFGGVTATEDIILGTVESFRPQLKTIGRVNQLHRDAEPAAGLSSGRGSPTCCLRALPWPRATLAGLTRPSSGWNGRIVRAMEYCR